MRFVRNLKLKEHLNTHFEQNLALKRNGDRTMPRDQYQGFADFVAARKHIIKQDGKCTLMLANAMIIMYLFTEYRGKCWW